ncbi:hypothetical protein DFQ27_007804, partial [Actinomortierella ambigua]
KMTPAPTISRLPKRNSTSLASSSRFNGSLAIASGHLQQPRNHHPHPHPHPHHGADFDYHDGFDDNGDDPLDADDGDRSALPARRSNPIHHRINDSFNQPAIPFESDMPPILPLGEYATDDHTDYTSDEDGYTHSEYDDLGDEEEEGHPEDEDELDLVRAMDSSSHDHLSSHQLQQQRRPSLDSRHSYSSKDNTASTSSTITNTTATVNSVATKATRAISTPATSLPSAPSSSTSLPALSTATTATTTTGIRTNTATSSSTTTPAAPSGGLFASKLKAPVSRLRPLSSVFSRTTPISSPLSQEIKHEDQDPEVTDQDGQDDRTGGHSGQQPDQDHLQAQESSESGLHARYLETEPDWMQEEQAEDGDDQDDEHLDIVEDDIGGLRYDPASYRGQSTGGQGRYVEEEMHGSHARLATIAEVSELPSMTSITHHLPHPTPSQLEPIRYHQSSAGRPGGGARGGVALGNRDLHLEDLMDEQDIAKEQRRQELLANLKPTDILGPIYETEDFKISSLTRPGPSWENNEDHIVPDYNRDHGYEDDHEQPEGSYGDYSVDEETDLDEEAAALKREYEELFGKGEAPPLAEIANSDIFLSEEEELEEEEEDEEEEEEDLEDDGDFGDEFTDSEEERYLEMLHFDNNNNNNRILENNIPRMPKPLEAPRGSMLPVPSSFGNRLKTSPPAPVSTARFPSRPPSTTPPSTLSSAAALNNPMPSSFQPPDTMVTPSTPSQPIGSSTASAIPAPRFSGAQSLLRRNQEIVAARQAAQQQQQQQPQQQQQQHRQLQPMFQNEKPMGNILDGLWDEPSEQDAPDEMSPGAMNVVRIRAELEREEEEQRASTQQDGGDPPRISRLPQASGLRPPMTYAPLRPSPLSSAAPIKAASRSSLATSEANSSPEGSPRMRLQQQQQPVHHQQRAVSHSPPLSSIPTPATPSSRISMATGGTRLARPSSLYDIQSTRPSRLVRPTSMYDTRALTPPSPPQEMQEHHNHERLSPKSRSPKDAGDIRRIGSQGVMATATTVTCSTSTTPPPPLTPLTQTFSRQDSIARKLELQREIQEIEAMEAAADAAEAARARGMAEDGREQRDHVVPSYMWSSQARVPTARTTMQTGSGVYDEEDNGQDPIESREVSPRSSMDYRLAPPQQHQQQYQQYQQQQQQQRPPAFSSSARTTTTTMRSTVSVPVALSSNIKPSRLPSIGSAGSGMHEERKLSPRSMAAGTGGSGFGLGLGSVGSGVQEQRRVLASSASAGTSRPLAQMASLSSAPVLTRTSRIPAGPSREASTSSSSSSSSLGGVGSGGGPLRRTAASATTLVASSSVSSSPTSSPSTSASTSTLTSRGVGVGGGSVGGGSQHSRRERIRLAIPTLAESCKRLASIQDEITKMRQEIHQLAQNQDQAGTTTTTTSTAGHSRRSSHSSNGSHNSAVSRSSGAQSRGSGSAEGRRQYEDGDDEERLPAYEHQAQTLWVREENGRQRQQQQRQQQQRPPTTTTSTALARSRSSRQIATTESTTPISTRAAIPSSSSNAASSWDHYGVVVCFVNPQ